MAKIIPIDEHFQHFLAEMKDSFWGDLYGQTRQTWQRLRRDYRNGRVAHLSIFFFPVPERWVPRPCVVCKGGQRCCLYYLFVMPRGLHRSYGAHHLHFITCSCYRRLPGLRSARNRDGFLSILEQTRERYRFVVVGYVVMPEHVHRLITEPEVGTPSESRGVNRLARRKHSDSRPSQSARRTGAPSVFYVPARSKAWATRPI